MAHQYDTQHRSSLSIETSIVGISSIACGPLRGRQCVPLLVPCRRTVQQRTVTRLRVYGFDTKGVLRKEYSGACPTIYAHLTYFNVTLDYAHTFRLWLRNAIVFRCMFIFFRLLFLSFVYERDESSALRKFKTATGIPTENLMWFIINDPGWNESSIPKRVHFLF